MASREYKILSDQTIFDVGVLTIGSLDGLYSLMTENGIPELSSVPTGNTISYTIPKLNPPSINSSAPSPPAVSSTYRSIENQSVYDICLMTYGDLNRVYGLITSSKFPNLQTRPSPNTIFTFNPQRVEDNIFKDYLKAKKITINTATDFIISGSLRTDDGVDISTDDGLIIEID